MGLAVLSACMTAASGLAGQQISGIAPPQASGPTAQSFQGSVTTGQATGQALDLTLDQAIQMGLKSNLGVILARRRLPRRGDSG